MDHGSKDVLEEDARSEADCLDGPLATLKELGQIFDRVSSADQLDDAEVSAQDTDHAHLLICDPCCGELMHQRAKVPKALEGLVTARVEKCMLSQRKLWSDSSSTGGSRDGNWKSRRGCTYDPD